MDFTLTNEDKLLMETVRNFIDSEVEPRMVEIERDNSIPQVVFDGAAQIGLFAISIPPEYGGLGLSQFQRVLVHQMLGRSGFGFAGAIAAHTGIGSEALVNIGTSEQKAKYLPGLAEGKIRTAFALTEPEAGSDAGAMRTTARWNGSEYVFNGTKHYISGALHADIFTVVARLENDPFEQRFGIFLLEKSLPGLSVGKPFETMGSRGHPTAEVIFEECLAPAESRLGSGTVNGWDAAKQTLMEGRPMVAARCLGACERLLEISIEYAKTRIQFGQTIGSFQAVRAMLADMSTKTETTRWITYFAATQADAGKASPMLVSQAKLAASEALGTVADLALQIQGGAGYGIENPVNRFYRDARVTRIYEGTSEIQREIIGKSLMKHGVGGKQ